MITQFRENKERETGLGHRNKSIKNLSSKPDTIFDLERLFLRKRAGGEINSNFDLI